MPEKGICAKCGEHRVLVAKEMCHSCNYGANKDLSKEEIERRKTEGAGPKRTYTRKAVAVSPSPALNEGQTDINEEGVITIRFKTDSDNDLYVLIADRARKNRRSVGEEMLTIMEMAITGGVDTEKVDIVKLKKILSRMRDYPTPNGNTREVFQVAFDMVTSRLDEMVAV